jgi:hypothetical protein
MLALRTCFVLFAGLASITNVARADCSDSTIRGDYTFTVHGQSLSADGTTSTGLIDGVGVISFDGAGNADQEDFVVKSGTQVPPANPSAPNASDFHTGETGTYSVNSDCTGSAVITLGPGNTRSLAFVIAQSGLAIHAIVSATTVGGSPAVLQVYSDFEKINRLNR